MVGFAKEENTAKEVIEKLDSIYQRASLATQLSCENKMFSTKFKEDMPLAAHFNIIDEMFVELQAAGSTLNEMNKVARLLLTLPSSYSSIVTAIQTLTDENLSLAFVKTRLLDFEIKLKNEKIETSSKVLSAESKSSDNATKQNFDSNKKSKNRKSHFKSNKKSFNNKKQQYSRKRNFQSPQQQQQQQQQYKKRCEHCGRNNHILQDCYFYKKSQSDLKSIQTTQRIDDSSMAFFGGVESSSTQLQKNDKITFFIDSGATDHLSNNLNIFTKIKDLQVPIKINIAKKGETIVASKIGSISIITDVGIAAVLENVLYAPELPYNLLSVRRMQQAQLRVIFIETGEVIVKKNDKVIFTGKPLNNLISVVFNINKNVYNKMHDNENKTALLCTYKIWHERLGHISKSKFLEIKRNSLSINDNLINKINPTDELCEACIYGKQARLPFSKVKDKSYVTRPLFMIHTDVCGPISPKTINDKSYFVTFIDEFTHYTVVYLLNYKSDVFKVFQDFVAKSEAHFNLKIVYLYCDNGNEYLSNEYKAFCVQKGIQYHLTVPHTPEQNGVAERMNRSLLEKARAMIHGADLKKEFWGEAILTSTYLLNISPTKAISSNTTPYELWHNKKPRLDTLKIFGCTAYVHDKNRKTKFDKKSFKGILVGYEQNGYKIFNTELNKFFIARDVIFDEINYKISRPSVHTEINENANSKIRKTDEKLKISESHNKINESVIETEKVDNESMYEMEFENDSSNELRRSDRLKNKPFISYNEEYCYHTYAQTIVSEIPKSYYEIKNRDDRLEWENAIQTEIDSLKQNKTWEIVPCPENKNIVDCKWIFTIKYDVHGNPSKYKARLVARGFSQVYLLDYDETFAPVARISTFRLIIAFANQYELLIHQMDVKTAFLNGELKDEIYMRIPEGFKAKENSVCKLNKAIYGLKQSARLWFERFDNVLKKHDFKNASVDRCLYILDKKNVTKNIYVLLYVDDVIIITYDKNVMNNFKNYLKNQFSMTDMHELKFFLDIKVERTKEKIMLGQDAYLQRILEKFNMSECNSINTPLPVKLNYDALNSNEYYDAPCKNLIGCLMYAMLCTRPDLCISINLLSRYQVKNNKELWINLKRILRYIKGSINFKLIYTKTDFKNVLVGYVDSDWASNELDRKSTSGYLFKLFDNCTISWNSKRQNSVATSSTEAEYMALYEGTREACWLKQLITQIKIEINNPIVIYEDNNGCIAIANNPTDHKRTKHIDIKYHFTREKVEQKEIIIKYISTGEQLADGFTKPLPAVQFNMIRKQIGLLES